MVLSSLSSKILHQIKLSRHILLHLHPAPDGDSVGSVLAFYWFLQSLNKEVTLIRGDSDFPQSLRILPGSDRIIPKTYFGINIADFDLFIILDSSAPNQISKFQPITFPQTLKTIVIDHHQTNRKYGDIDLIDTKSPAVSQILFQLFTKWHIKIIPKIAVNLLIGIYTDTGGFKYNRTTSTTFEIAVKLSKICPDFTDYIFEIENNHQPEQLKYRGLALSLIETFFSDHVALSPISYETLKINGIAKSHTEKSDISNLLKSVPGWEIGVSLVETEPGICSVSLRNRDAKIYDVAKIAAALGNGGGHSAAAGATINLPLPEAKKYLLNIIHQLHPELGSP